ncbi:hypothetical protein JQK88_34650 [Mesorhizobium caraganae]|uniref:hypothetical protein n=1 Tax=Mesorhizobium caraganae TaxID=483206 RepID=UPI00193A41B8|nr:hypothetical protein [Mesorhizobium caraganae]MBM2716211.1 hypothetical protein [Mesorhizobium caraganae]
MASPSMSLHGNVTGMFRIAKGTEREKSGDHRRKLGATTEDEAIETAMEQHGKDATTSVAYCALEASGNREDPEYRFWFDLFLRLLKRDHVGWA